MVQNCVFAVREFFSFSPFYALFGIFVIAGSSVISVIEATYYVKHIVESIEQGKPFLTTAVFIVGFGLISTLFWCISQIYESVIGRAKTNAYERDFNKKLFRKAGNVEVSCYEDTEFYDKYTRALDGIPNRIMNVWYETLWAVSHIARVVYLLAVMFAVDKGVALFLVFPMVGNFLFGRLLNDIEQKRYKENTKFERAAGYVMRVLHLGKYSKEIRLTGVYELMRAKFREAIGGSFSVFDRYALKTGGIYWIKVQFTFTLIFEGLLAYCAYRSLVSGTINLAEMTVMSSIMTNVTWQIICLSDSVIYIHENSIHIQNARDFLSYEPKIPEDACGIRVPDVIEKIEFKNVKFTYKGADLPALDGVSFTLEAGKCAALVGDNGAGKSTVVKLLLRLYDPDEGEILLNGINIKEFEVKSYRAAFSAAFQDHQILAMTVLENLTMGQGKEASRSEAERILGKVGLWDKIKSLDKGLDTVMTREFDDNGTVFSGGETQKLAVARALWQNGKAAVFDEPSSALDPIAEYDLFAAIMSECRGKLSLIISHRLSSVKTADMIIVIENGRVSEIGDHAELMRKKGHYCEMFSSQAKSYLASDTAGGDTL